MPVSISKGKPHPQPHTSFGFRSLGLLALAFYLAHPFRVYILGGSPAQALWFCHLGNLILALGLLLVWPRVVGISTLWLIFGTSVWALDLAAGGEFLPTSLLVHPGGALLAIFASWKLGFPRGSWILAAVLMLALQIITRWLCPPELNVNLAFRVWAGWEKIFTSYMHYMAMMYAITLASFFSIELIFRNHLRRIAQ